MKNIYIILIIFSFFASSCKEDSIMTFGEKRYIHFEQTEQFVHRFSFANVQGSSSYELKIPITYIGRILEKDALYKVEVVKQDKADNLPDNLFKIVSNNKFSGQTYKDTLRILLYDGKELAKEKTLIIRFVKNENFLPGLYNSISATVHVSNIMSQPAWWDKSMDDILGKYSKIKHKHLLISSKNADLDNCKIEELMAYITDFIYYLRELDKAGKSVYEEDGRTKVIDGIPYSKKI